MQYVYVYKLKIATIKLELFADWIVILNVNIAFKNAILDLSTGINTKVKVTGKLTLSAGIGSIGGVADGVLLDT